MNLGTEALGRLALGQELDALFGATILTAASASFASSGQAVAFRIQEPLAFGSYTLVGPALGCQTQATEDVASFALAGGLETFQAQFTDTFGGFALTGRPAVLAPTLTVTSGTFSADGRAVAFQLRMGSTEWVVSEDALGSSAVGQAAVGQGDSFEGAFPLTFNYALTGGAATDLDTEVAEPGFYALSGSAFLSHEFLGGGGTLSGGTFSRGRWRALQDGIAAERESEARTRARDLARRRAAAKRAATAAKAARDAARAREDAVNAGLARDRALAGALDAVTGARSVSGVADGSARLIHAARTARALADARDEEEALALLLAA